MFPQTGGGGKGTRPNQAHIQQLHSQQQQQQQQQPHQTQYQQSHHSSHNVHQPPHIQQQTHPQQQSLSHITLPSQNQQTQPTPQQLHQYHSAAAHQQNQANLFYSLTASHIQHQLLHNQQQVLQNNAAALSNPSPPTHIGGAAASAVVAVSSGSALPAHGGSSGNGAGSSKGTRTQTHVSSTPAMSTLQHFATHAPPAHTPFMTTYIPPQYANAVMAAVAANGQFSAAVPGLVGQHATPATPTGQQALFQTPAQQRPQDQHRQSQQHLAHQQQAPLLQHPMPYYHPTAATSAVSATQLQAQQHAQFTNTLLPTSSAGQPRHQQPTATYIMNAYALQSSALPPTGTRPPLLPHQPATANGNIITVPLAQNRNAVAAGAGATFITAPFCPPTLQMSGAPQAILPATAMGNPPIQTYARMSAGQLSALGAATGAVLGSETKTRKHAIPIIDPITKENILETMPQKKSTEKESPPPITYSSAITITAPPPETSEEQQAQLRNQSTAAQAASNSNKSTLDKSTTVNVAQANTTKIDHQMQTDAIKDKYAVGTDTKCSKPPVTKGEGYMQEEPANYAEQTFVDQQQNYAAVEQPRYMEQKQDFEDEEYVYDEEDEPLEEENIAVYVTDHVPTVEFAARELHQGDATNLCVAHAAEEHDWKRSQKAAAIEVPNKIPQTRYTLDHDHEEHENSGKSQEHDMATSEKTVSQGMNKFQSSKQNALNKSKSSSDAGISSASSSNSSTPTHQSSSASASGGQQTAYQRQQQRQSPKGGFMTANVTMQAGNPAAYSNQNNSNAKKQVKFTNKRSPKESKQKIKGQKFEASSGSRQQTSDSYNNNNSNFSNIEYSNDGKTTNLGNVALTTTDTNKQTCSISAQDNESQLEDVSIRQEKERYSEEADKHQSESTSHTGSEEDIVAQYLRPQASSDNFRFLHKSLSSDESDLTPRACLHDDSIPSDIRQISFGDLPDYKELTKSKELLVQDANGLQTLTDTVDHARQTVEATITVTPAMVDAVAKEPQHKSKQKETKAAAATQLQLTPEQNSINNSSKSKRPTQFKYTHLQLRDYGKSALSLRSPAVLFQKGDCISHLFVSRAHNAASAAQPHNLPPPPQPYYGMPYQHQSQHLYYGDMDGGKRRGGSGGGGGAHMKKHHDYQLLSSSSSANASSQMQNKDIIHVHLSLREEIKLAKSENAWQPETLRQNLMRRQPQDSAASTTGDEDDIEAVLKKVRGILNKLTPMNFDVLLKSMTSISINTPEKMRQVMLLIFEKTVSEPNFAPTYARFCKVLFQEIKSDKSSFTTLLIRRIQEEFESNVNNADAKKLKLQPLIDKLQECQDPKDRLELQAEIEDKELQFRRRAWGTVRFIGEMYKQQLLPCDRVFNCVESLLQQNCEDKLEYMCKLLTTVGHLVETPSPGSSNKSRMDQIFVQIRDFVQVQKSSRSAGGRKVPIVPQPKISSRVRFMMQDVIELRDRQWDQPFPVTIQTRSNSKADDKSNTRKEPNSSSVLPSGAGARAPRSGHQHSQRHLRNSTQDKRYDPGPFSQKQYKTLPSQAADHRQQQQPIDVNKLKFSGGTEEAHSHTMLGSKLTYVWRQAPATGRSVTQQAPVPKQNSTDSTSPSDSGSRSREDSATGYRNSFRELDKSDTASTAHSSSAEDLSTSQSMSNHECQKMLDGMLEDLLNGSLVGEQEAIAAWQEKSEAQQTSVLQYLLSNYLHLKEIKQQERKACAQIFSKLMDRNIFNRKVFLQAYEQFGKYFHDTLVDVPNGWVYEFEFLGPLLHEGVLQFKDIWLTDWIGKPEEFRNKFVHALLHHFTYEFGAQYARNVWHSEFERGRLIFGEHIDKDWPKFMESKTFEFILEPNKPVKPPRPALQNVVEQLDRIRYLLRTSKDCECALDFINTNVQVTCSFVRALTSMICDECVSIASAGANPKDAELVFDAPLFREKYVPLLFDCINEKDNLAHMCLEAVVESLRNSSQEWRASNELICKIFAILREHHVIRKEVFCEWYKQLRQSSDEPNEAVDAGVNNRSRKKSAQAQKQSSYALAGNSGSNSSNISSSSGSSNSNQRPPPTDKNFEIHAFMKKMLSN